ncbi:hypothetical protein B0G77_8038 [Paraburkholderia sp. BL10I2N1]|nr:hypothetical protein B0G77_8038 [Paraburkholderia sp. BL10I2N1]
MAPYEWHLVQGMTAQSRPVEQGQCDVLRATGAEHVFPCLKGRHAWLHNSISVPIYMDA